MDGAKWYLVTDLIVNAVVAAGTLAAVGVAVYVAWREHKARIAAEQRADAVEERERTRVEREERAQASGVLVHLNRNQGFFVTNDSDQPIFGAQVTYRVPDFHYTHQTENEQSIPAHTSRRVSFRHAVSLGHISTFAVAFHDANGLRWARFDSGGLTRIPEDRTEAHLLIQARITTE